MTYDIDAHRQELLRVFKNSPADLQANRGGRLGAGQVRRMRRSAANAILAMVGFAVVVGAIVIGVATKPIQPWRWGLIALVIVGALVAGLYRSAQLRRALRDGGVVGLAGPVRVGMRGRSGWWLTVDGRSFHLPVRFWHVGPGVGYRVYAASAAELIVAMEPDDLGSLLVTPIVFTATGDGERPYTAVDAGRAVTVHVNDFPAEPLYSVFADGARLGDLDDWPPAWTRPVMPANLRAVAAAQPGGAALVAATEPMDIAALRVWATALCEIDAADTASVLRALRFGGTLVPKVGYRIIEPPVAQTTWTAVDERDGELTDLRFKPGRVPVTRGALDAEFGTGQELVRVHYDSDHRIVYRVRLDGTPFTCDITASFGERPVPDATVTEIALRRQRP